MQLNIRRKQNSALHAAGLNCSSPSPQANLLPPDAQFHLDLWLGFTVQNYFLDVGHTILMLLRRSPRSMPSLAVHLGVIAVVMGTSLHLVVDSVVHRLLSSGYQLHLPINENPLLKMTKPPSLVGIIEMLFFFDQTIGHLLWCVPLFLALFLYFGGCFCHKQKRRNIPAAAWMLSVPNAVYFWFLITERQTFILFTFTFFAMAATVMHQRRRGMVPNSNGLLMLSSFSTAFIMVGVWIICLWNNEALRRRHPGLIYLPQPSVVYSLHQQDVPPQSHTSQPVPG
ncbi:ceroid-lipofuscinosis neuronal protein 6 homolog isoform 1-T1 [Synchiropus picturatus]